jgi:hypothetical protein
LNPNDKDEDIL